MTDSEKWAILGAISLCIGIIGFVATASSKDEVPRSPIAHIGPHASPVYSTDDVDEIEGELRLIRLSDGHDYWFYLDGNSDRGYAALAHSPECNTCRPKTGK